MSAYVKHRPHHQAVQPGRPRSLVRRRVAGLLQLGARMSLGLQIRRASRLPGRLLLRVEGRFRGTRCPVCGRSAVHRRRTIISDELAEAWELTPDQRAQFDEREGVYCSLCGSNRRSQWMAESLLRWAAEKTGATHGSLAALSRAPAFHALRVAELNACGQLHPWLAAHPGLAYSEYNAQPPVRSEDLLHLSYSDASFDLVLTSETLEHVPDLDRALSELRRILRPGGVHLFTVPVVWDRPHSRTCAVVDDAGAVRQLRPPSHHGLPGTTAGDMLVFTEFGADFPGRLEQAGFRVRVNRHPVNPALCTFITENTA